ncbi:hypothetical protein METHB2_150055 [Candidatus Methylobacter favarea]|uniref:Uncharacterized protein n=1 Tax=Candidatus Methylobacter favarea TaxID=2707345 RepID=A0A8S0WHM7_9GAMM|nr:hypothetical protein METHB2_150055 [Candidatus Methylobacter favarea]
MLAPVDNRLAANPLARVIAAASDQLAGSNKADMEVHGSQLVGASAAGAVGLAGIRPSRLCILQ